MAPTAKSKHLSRVTHVTPASHHRSAAALRPEHDNGDFLVTLGKRVRELRNRRGMIRKMLAHQADVSERHLAQLEAGEGNVSVVLLRRIANALGVSLAEPGYLY